MNPTKVYLVRSSNNVHIQPYRSGNDVSTSGLCLKKGLHLEKSRWIIHEPEDYAFSKLTGSTNTLRGRKVCDTDYIFEQNSNIAGPYVPNEDALCLFLRFSSDQLQRTWWVVQVWRKNIHFRFWVTRSSFICITGGFEISITSWRRKRDFFRGQLGIHLIPNCSRG